MPTARVRIDQLLVQRGLAPSRDQAQRLIRAGRVRVDGQLQIKPAHAVADDAKPAVEESPRFVGHGGEKLEAAFTQWNLDATGRVCLDVGSSTGGFTDCLLQHGARCVYAVDVGYGQIDPKLRGDPRVVVLERQNIRQLPRETVPEPVDLITLDLSFISLTLVLPKVLMFLRPGGEIMALVKPQFEVGKGQVGKGGVVRDPELQRQAVDRVTQAARALGLQVSAAFPSPLKGPKGNQEYFLHLLAPNPSGPAVPIDKIPGSL